MKSEEKRQRLVLISAAVFSAFGFMLGLLIASYFENSDLREPASDKSSKEMQLLSQKNLLNSASVVKSDRGWGIEFGSFRVLNATGETTDVCDTYENLELVFVADGMAVSGDLPKMTVRGPCKKIDNSDHIQAFYLSKKEITRTPAADKEMSHTTQQLNLSFNNLSDSWPPMWVLQSMRFFSQGGQELNVSAEEVRLSRPTPLVLEW